MAAAWLSSTLSRPIPAPIPPLALAAWLAGKDVRVLDLVRRADGMLLALTAAADVRFDRPSVQFWLHAFELQSAPADAAQQRLEPRGRMALPSTAGNARAALEACRLFVDPSWPEVAHALWPRLRGGESRSYESCPTPLP